MKKSMIVLAAFFSAVIFQSCGNSQAGQEMQKPTTSTAAVTAASTGSEKEGKEAEAGEMTATSQTNSGNSAAVADSKALNLKNLQDAFKGETTASAKYAAYSAKAEKEGYHEIALLFSAASKSENIHANNHKSVLEELGQKVPVIKPEFTVNATKENLKDAITGEGYEISTMYPEFLKNANTVGDQLSLISLNYAYKTEQKHKVFYEKALAALEANNVKSLALVYYVCPTCGNTYETSISKRCGISMTSSEKFIKIASLTS